MSGYIPVILANARIQWNNVPPERRTFIDWIPGQARYDKFLAFAIYSNQGDK
jgi:hypothetical protein